MPTRFAPSPTGRLHLGHAYAALFAWERAQERNDRFLLRLEDLDQARARPQHEETIYQDLRWLGLTWEQPVWRQSERPAAYQAALDQLAARDLLYPCFCTRKDIQTELARITNAPHGPEGPLYPGTCRQLSPTQRQDRLAQGQPHSLRLDLAQALAQTGPLTWHEIGLGDHTGGAEALGDVILSRKDAPAAYHLAVVVDDAAQGIDLVTRGEDLRHATPLHRLLQELLGLPVPQWQHHRLIRDENGHRLAKRHPSLTLANLRAQGETPDTLQKRLAIHLAESPRTQQPTRN
ncbi:MAG: tRNA glutamyl-Q(34) synthetase GluQRS [Verrucomicrobiota bacterium]